MKHQITCAFAAISLLSFSVLADEPARGQLLYENHCKKCHEPNVHTRENSRVETIVDLSKWVIRWQYDQKLDWDYDAVNDVVKYLNATYYSLGAVQ